MQSTEAESEADTTTPSYTATAGLPRGIAAAIHLLAVPLWVIGPLLALWLSRSEYVREHARHAFNWQATYGMVIYLAAVMLAIAFLTSDIRLAVIAPNLALIAIGGNFLFSAVGAVNAARGNVWEYPVAIRIKESATISRTF